MYFLTGCQDLELDSTIKKYNKEIISEDFLYTSLIDNYSASRVKSVNAFSYNFSLILSLLELIV